MAPQGSWRRLMEGPAPPIRRATEAAWEGRMTEGEILAEFRAADALLEGHFILSSGLHSPRYLQCARVLMDPMRASRLASALVATLPRETRSRIEIVVSPAMGGVIAGHEVARALGVEALFVERPTGRFELRRGFRLKPGQKVLLMEDVVTTGLSSREAMAAVEEAGGEVIAAAALVDRSNGAADMGVPFFPLIRLAVPVYEADALPPELAQLPAEKPGSRTAVSDNEAAGA
jgi:orotate phosphoribosyltransferase